MQDCADLREDFAKLSHKAKVRTESVFEGTLNVSGCSDHIISIWCLYAAVIGTRPHRLVRLQ